MAWLSLLTRVVPKLFQVATKATSSVVRGTAKTTAEVAGVIKNNPKASAVAAVASYAGWKNLGTNDSFGTSVGKTVREATSGAGNFAHDAVNGFTGKNTVENVKEKVSTTVDSISETANETKDLLGGLGNIVSGFSQMIGNGFNMITGLFSNIGSGKLSGLGLAGLLASAYLIFGRSGILGKIGGALLGMLMLNGTSQHQQQSQTSSQSVQQDNPHLSQQQGNLRR